jgi:tRNA(fMet)-specific endonuclease VapC
MSLYVLDTDTCIYWLNGKEQIKEKVKHFNTHKLRTTIVTFAELRYGVYKSQRVEENLRKSDHFLKKVKILPLDREAADTFGKLKADLHRKGTPLSDFDLLIAAITLRYKGIIVTNNIEHFKKIEGLHYENWLE